MSASMFSFLLLAIPTALAAYSNGLTAELLPTIGAKITNENCVYSPVSVQNVLALLYLGAGSETASELKSVFQFTDDKVDVAEKFGRMLAETKKKHAVLEIGDRFYVNKKLNLTPKFRQLAKTFSAEILKMQCLEAGTEDEEINSWVRQRTANKIEDLIINNRTDWSAGAVVVNEIYFKAKWLHAFPKERTHTVEDNKTHKKYEMMVQDKVMLFAALKDLNAYAAQLKMQGTNISMLVLQPKDPNGLSKLEEQLKDVDLTRLPQSMTAMKVTLMVPKFKFEFDMPLKPVLRQIGLRSMFRHADFTDLLEGDSKLDISEIRHKGVIEINEEGIEAAGGTGVEVRPPVVHRNDSANRHFFFAIIDEENVYFAGHVANMPSPTQAVET